MSTATHRKKKYDLSKMAECKVCGKKFLRGTIDLVRHQSAVTLQHHWSSDKTDTCAIKCEFCGIFFPSTECISLHQVWVCGSSGPKRAEDESTNLTISLDSLEGRSALIISDGISSTFQDKEITHDENHSLELLAKRKLKRLKYLSIEGNESLRWTSYELISVEIFL